MLNSCSSLKKILSPPAAAGLLALTLGLGLGPGLAGSSPPSIEPPKPETPGVAPAEGAQVRPRELPFSDPLRFEAGCNPDPCSFEACAPQECTTCDNVDRCAEDACFPGGEELCGGGGGPGFDPGG
jgi:hypothetical protein